MESRVWRTLCGREKIEIMTPLTKYYNGMQADESHFNAPLVDADENFADLEDWNGQRFSEILVLAERVTALEGASPPEGNPGGFPGTDNIWYIWKDAGTITLKAGGRAISGDSVEYEIEEDTDITFADLDTGSEEANKFYYIWIGQEDGTQAVKLSLSATTPYGLTSPHRLDGGIRNNNSSNIIPFVMSNGWMYYDVDVLLNGSDLTGVSATISTSFTDIDLSAFLPSGSRMIEYAYANSNNLYYHRVKGSAVSNGIGLYTTALRRVMVDASGIFQAKNNTSVATYHTVLAYEI
jgi:hypothetical protein